jgi:hypothetical protein
LCKRREPFKVPKNGCTELVFLLILSKSLKLRLLVLEGIISKSLSLSHSLSLSLSLSPLLPSLKKYYKIFLVFKVAPFKDYVALNTNNSILVWSG